MPSHYCRHSSTKTYLPETLSLSEMYRMYQSECQQNQTMPVKKEFYFSVFHKDFNIGFHKPKKDLCDFCETFARSSDAEKEAMQIRMDEHLKKKTVSRQLKEEMKLWALTDSSLNAACFDLQQVLVTPRSMSSQLYYRRKLATYNLTVYELATKQGHCFMWHEGVAKRRANNIASCLWKYINDKVACQCKEYFPITEPVKTKIKLLRLYTCTRYDHCQSIVSRTFICKHDTRRTRVTACTP